MVEAQTFWRHSKTGRRYFVYLVVPSVEGLLVLYHEPGVAVSYDWALHTETKAIIILDDKLGCWELSPGPNCAIKVEGKHLWARPAKMWNQSIKLDGEDVPRFVKEGG